MWLFSSQKTILIDESPLFVITGRWFCGGIRTAGPPNNFRDYGSSSPHAHTGTDISIYLSFSVHHCSEKPIQPTAYLLIHVLFVTTAAPSSVAHVQQTPSEVVTVCGYQGEVGVIDIVHRVPVPLSAGEFR